MQKRRERSIRLSSGSATGSLFMTNSMPNMSMFSFENSLLSDETLQQMSHEDRSRRAFLQRRALTSENVVRRLNSMRGAHPDRLPQSYDVFEHCSADTRGDWGAQDAYGCFARDDRLDVSFYDDCRGRRSSGGAQQRCDSQ